MNRFQEEDMGHTVPTPIKGGEIIYILKIYIFFPSPRGAQERRGRSSALNLS